MLVVCVLALLAGQAFGRSTMIIGGERAEVGAWPHQGSLQRSGSHNCGCALISNRWLVTAAHCVGNSASSYTVVLGATELGNNNLGKPTRFNLQRIIKHERYGSGAGSYPNDIALMYLNTAASLGQYIDTIALAQSGANFAGKRGYITGWGLTSVGGGGSLPRWLQQADINVYSRRECEDVWGSSINDGHVCIGDSAQGHGACNGDSGGPLVVGNVLVGVTSWGVNGCSPRYPSVYSSIAYFRNWIKNNSGI